MRREAVFPGSVAVFSEPVFDEVRAASVLVTALVTAIWRSYI
jgi:hypothetical protein